MVVGAVLEGDGGACDWGAQRGVGEHSVYREVLVDGCCGWSGGGEGDRCAHRFVADGVDVAVLAPDVDHPVGDGGRRAKPGPGQVV